MEQGLEKFIDLFSDLFEDTEKTAFTPDCRFKDLDEWSSLIAISVVGMVDEEYGVSLRGDDVKLSDTISDLYNVVDNKTDE